MHQESHTVIKNYLAETDKYNSIPFDSLSPGAESFFMRYLSAISGSNDAVGVIRTIPTHRISAMVDYLTLSNKMEKYHGRAIVAEALLPNLLTHILPPQFDAINAPPSVDASIREKTGARLYQRGADAIVKDAEGYPVMGIDVSMIRPEKGEFGERAFLLKKLESPGVNCQFNIPVTVLPLAMANYDIIEGTQSLESFYDDVVLPEIMANGGFDFTAVMEQMPHLKSSMRNALMIGIRTCRLSLYTEVSDVNSPIRGSAELAVTKVNEMLKSMKFTM